MKFPSKFLIGPGLTIADMNRSRRDHFPNLDMGELAHKLGDGHVPRLNRNGIPILPPSPQRPKPKKGKREPLSDELIQSVWAKTDGRCWYCGCDLICGGRGDDRFSVDHVIPVHSGGSDKLKNLVPACRKCNALKGHMRLGTFRVKFVGDAKFYGETMEVD